MLSITSASVGAIAEIGSRKFSPPTGATMFTTWCVRPAAARRGVL